MRGLAWWAGLAVAGVLVGAAASVPVRHLTEPDEARYAEVAREMIASGDWLVPHLGGAPYTHKPPLYLWLSALLRTAGCPWTAAAVLPVLLAFLGTLALLFPLGGRLGLSREECLLAVLILASTPFFSAFALIGRMDMLLVLSHAGALVALAALLAGRGDARSQRGPHLLFWVAVAAGVLLKGPVALALAGLTALAWGVLEPGSRLLRRVFLGWGPLLAVGIVLAWLVPAALASGGAYLQDLVLRQSVGRISQSFAHRQPFYYHLLTYPFTALPWTPVILWGLYLAVRRRADRPQCLLAGAVAVVLLFFSLVSGKIVIYLLPLFPAASLLAARVIGQGAARSRLFGVVAAMGVVLFGVATAVVPRVRHELSGGAADLLPVGGVVALLGAIAGFRVLRRGRAWTLLGLGGALFPALALPVLAYHADAALSAFEVSSRLLRLEPEAADVLTVDLDLFGLPLYTDRPVRALASGDEVRAALSAGRVVVVRRSSRSALSAALAGLSVEEVPCRFARPPLLLLRAAPAGQGR